MISLQEMHLELAKTDCTTLNGWHMIPIHLVELALATFLDLLIHVAKAYLLSQLFCSIDALMLSLYACL